MHKFLFSAVLLLSASALLAADAKPEPTAAEKQAIAQIRQMGALALEIAQNDPHLEVSYQQAEGTFNDTYLAPLKALKGLIVHLSLAGKPVTDAQMAHLSDLTGLTELHLEKTKITDKGLEHLKGLVNLEYLNLYETPVSDAGLPNLYGMKKLKHIYLWQTKVTPDGAAKLKKALPGLDVNLGLVEPPKPETKKPEEKKPETKKPETKKPETKKPETKKPETKKPEEKKPETKKPEPKKK